MSILDRFTELKESQSQDVWRDLKKIKAVALHYAQQHGVNYTIFIKNPSESGDFTEGSTYEFVTDSYFEKERPNIKILNRTDDLFKAAKEAYENQLGYSDDWQPYRGYEKYEYDIKLFTDEVVENCYPNAGEFTPFSSNRGYDESRVIEIRFSNRPVSMLNLNVSEHRPIERDDYVSAMEGLSSLGRFTRFYDIFTPQFYAESVRNDNRNFRPKQPRTLPKVGRNEPCNCGCGARKSKFCTKNTEGV